MIFLFTLKASFSDWGTVIMGNKSYHTPVVIAAATAPGYVAGSARQTRPYALMG